MIRIYGKFLTKEQRKFLKLGIIYTLNYILDPKYLENANINIYISDGNVDGDENSAHGTCEFMTDEDSKSCNIWLYKGLIKPRAKNTWYQFNEMLYYLFHELVHCKQYFSGELIDCNGDKEYIFLGVKYKAPEPDDEDGYYNQPHEREAYGRQQHLVMRFYRHMFPKEQ